MQHLDEGTIHSWLDGALSVDEAALAEAHVAECPQCAAAVAEARGFIAASSRILTALDNAPRGVIPAAAPRKRVNPLVWRVAATVLVVAAGTLVVVQNRGSNENPTSASTDRAPLTARPTPVAEQVPAATGQAVVAADQSASKAAVSDAPEIALSAKTGARNQRPGISAREGRALTAAGATTRTDQNAAPNYAGAAAPTAPTSAPSLAAGIVAMDAASEQVPLKVVGAPRKIGAKITLYEVAPGDTVTLTESTPISLNSIVLRGAAGAPMAQRTTEKSAAAIAAPAPSQQEVAKADRTITWTDPATGNTLTLTGRMPEARLQEIRIRIDRERAAAAKKNP